MIEKLSVVADAGGTNENVLRLQLLETLLTSARATAVAAGMEFQVIADER